MWHSFYKTFNVEHSLRRNSFVLLMGGAKRSPSTRVVCRTTTHVQSKIRLFPNALSLQQKDCLCKLLKTDLSSLCTDACTPRSRTHVKIYSRDRERERENTCEREYLHCYGFQVVRRAHDHPISKHEDSAVYRSLFKIETTMHTETQTHKPNTE